MPYQQYSLDSIAVQLGILLDDQTELYWSRQEKYFAVWEAMYVWGAMTSYWRNRGAFAAQPSDPSPYYDLSVQLPALRTRTWTLGQMVQDIQYMCLEAANGISGSGMSGQISITSILQSIQRARNRFILDAHIPFSVSVVLVSPVPPSGLVAFSSDYAYVHRAAWQDHYSGIWANLWREDAWAADKANQYWTVQPGMPVQFSESEISPLTLQLVPPPTNIGSLEVISIRSEQIDLTLASTTFGIPDEWVHAVKYAALADIFTSESQNKDIVRGNYAEMRYKQAVDAVQSMRSVIRILLDNVPLPMDSLAAIDAGFPYWRNTRNLPFICGALQDIVVLVPLPSALCGISVDVVQAAPIPRTGSDFLPIGPEDISTIIDYATHVLSFKCGGKEFESSFSQYNSFLGAVGGRKQINKVKLKYLTPLLGQPLQEEAMRPDTMKVGQPSA